jgi:DNA-directed RNA polymerase sigma subunit (sigma70/sigma32)
VKTIGRFEYTTLCEALLTIPPEALAALSPKEERILTEHYGLAGQPKRSIPAIGETYGVGPGIINSIHRQAIRKLADRGYLDLACA